MLCKFANDFPTFVADFLQRGKTLRRRFREETITDLLMGNLLAVGGGHVIVEFPNEPVTGADMEWNFANLGSGKFFRIMLQAKRLYGDGKVWTRHCYRELFHTVGNSGKLQAQVLGDASRAAGVGTYPLYIFYHPARTCDLALMGGVTSIQGINLVDAFFVEGLVTSAKTRAQRTRHKSIGMIYPFVFSLSKLLCPSSVRPLGVMARGPGGPSMPLVLSFVEGRPVLGLSLPPTPEDIRQRLVNFRSGDERIQRKLALPSEENPGWPDEFFDVPEVASAIPDDVLGIIESRGSAKMKDPREPLTKWRVTFVSFGPSDQR